MFKLLLICVACLTWSVSAGAGTGACEETRGSAMLQRATKIDQKVLQPLILSDAEAEDEEEESESREGGEAHGKIEEDAMAASVSECPAVNGNGNAVSAQVDCDTGDGLLADIRCSPLAGGSRPIVFFVWNPAGNGKQWMNLLTGHDAVGVNMYTLGKNAIKIASNIFGSQRTRRDSAAILRNWS